MNHRFVHTALLEQGHSEVVVGFRVVGFDFQRLFGTGRSLRPPALVEQGHSVGIVVPFGMQLRLPSSCTRLFEPRSRV